MSDWERGYEAGYEECRALWQQDAAQLAAAIKPLVDALQQISEIGQDESPGSQTPSETIAKTALAKLK